MQRAQLINIAGLRLKFLDVWNAGKALPRAAQFSQLITHPFMCQNFADI
jgi:hypothetical protein